MTQLYRNTSRVKRIFNIVTQHYLLRCFRLTQNIRQAALQVVNLAVSEKYEGSYLLTHFFTYLLSYLLMYCLMILAVCVPILCHYLLGI